MKLISLFTSAFGYSSNTEFSDSLIHKTAFAITIPLAGISALIEHYIGINFITLIAFIVLLLLELITGLTASKKKGIKIESKKFSRFGLKIFVWISLFFIANSLKLQYKEESVIVYSIFEWLHSGLMIFASLEYLISVLENLSVITGQKNTGIINAIKRKLKKFLE